METIDTRDDVMPTDDGTTFDPFYEQFNFAAELPMWLKLKRDIRAELERLTADMHRSASVDVAGRLQSINARIESYNKHVPNVYLRKSPLSAANWMEHDEEWE